MAIFVPRQAGQKYCCRSCGIIAAGMRLAQREGDARSPPPAVIALRAANVRKRRGSEFELESEYDRLKTTELARC
jgi:hypothetical protein